MRTVKEQESRRTLSLQKLWKKQKKAEGDKMTVEEYVSLMMDAAVDAKLVPA